MDYGGEVTAERQPHEPEEVGLDDSGPVHEVDWSVAAKDNFAAPFGRTVVTGERPAREHERTITDQIGVTDEGAAAVEPAGPEPIPLSAPFADGIKDLAETAMSSVDLDSTVKGLAETVGGAIDGESVQALAETARAVASGGDATVRPGTIRAKVDVPTPTAGQSTGPGDAHQPPTWTTNSGFCAHRRTHLGATSPSSCRSQSGHPLTNGRTGPGPPTRERDHGASERLPPGRRRPGRHRR